MPSPSEVNPQAVPPTVARRLRELTHDLSNSLETIVQANYLVRQSPLRDDARQWVEMTEKAAETASRINREIRELLRPLK
jgi:DNA-binding MarR family transcriptional regulator